MEGKLLKVTVVASLELEPEVIYQWWQSGCSWLPALQMGLVWPASHYLKKEEKKLPKLKKKKVWHFTYKSVFSAPPHIWPPWASVSQGKYGKYDKASMPPYGASTPVCCHPKDSGPRDNDHFPILQPIISPTWPLWACEFVTLSSWLVLF